ncbi:MAG: hypothetical protein ACE37M_10055 [Henriciella sp.]
MTHRFLLGALALGLSGMVAAPMANAACDISDTKCAVNGGKCNIKFKNRTGDASGSGDGSNIKQTSSAQTILVRAIRADDSKAGNTLSITAGASNTMNIEKKAKKNFEFIGISSKDLVGSVDSVGMSCAAVKAVLNGNGTCKVFHGAKQEQGRLQLGLGYQCDGGKVNGSF